MQVSPLLLLDGCSAQDVLHSDIFKLSSVDNVYVLRYDSDMQIRSKLSRPLLAVKSLTFKESWGVILFKFQQHIKKFFQEIGLGPGFNSTSPLTLIMRVKYKVNNIKVNDTW